MSLFFNIRKKAQGRVTESLLYLMKFYKNKIFNMHLTQKELGKFSSISEENTVRILNEFKHENIINLNSREIEIPDQQLLEKISEFE